MLLKALCKGCLLGKLFNTKTCPGFGGMLLKMKCTAIFLLLACITVSANTTAQRITLTVKEASLEQVFREIKKQSGYSFVYTKDLLAKAKKVSLQVNNSTVEAVLQQCFAGQPFSFKIISTVVIINTKETVNPVAVEKPELPLPPINVTGRITNEKGEPVIASITVKGATMGTTSNAEGYFELKGVAENATLVISGVSIVTFEFRLNGKTDLGVLQAKIKADAVEQVEVTYNTGYQHIAKERATGSFVHIDNELYNRKLGANVLDRIGDVASGVLRSPNGSFTIRGISTINSGKDPLVIVDNFPVNTNNAIDFISTINPNDVASVTILKDAAAASIWGARAGNGVIVITTKKGKLNQRPQLQVVSNVTIGQKPDLFYRPSLSSKDQVAFERMLFDKGLYNDYDDVYPAFGYLPALPQAIELLLAARRGAITQQQAETQLALLEQNDIGNDVRKYLQQTSITQQYAFNVSGGGDKYTYYASVGYDRNRPTEVKNHNSRLTFNVGNTYQPFKNLELRADIAYGASHIYSVPTNQGEFSPYDRLVDDNGNALYVPFGYRSSYIDTATYPALLDWRYRPVDELNYRNSQSRSYNMRLAAAIAYTVLPGIRVELQYQNNKTLGQQRIYISQQSFELRNSINQFMDVNSSGQAIYPFPLGDQLERGGTESTTWNGRLQVSVNKSWGRHQLNAVAGAEVGQARFIDGAMDRILGYNPSIGQGQFVDPVGLYMLRPDNYITRLPVSTNLKAGERLTRNGSEFANVGYVYNTKYVFSASGRFDRSNFFGVKANLRQVPLWSAGLSWKISREKFYSLSWLPELSVRATYGYNGNTNTGASAYTTIRYNTNPSFIPVNISSFADVRTPANPSLRWERVKVINLGLDFGFVNDRVSGSIEYYTKNGIDLIGPIENLDPTTGLLNFTGNRAGMKGQGVDISLRTNNITGAFSWSSVLLFNYNTDKVTEYLGQKNYTGATLISGTPVTGKPLSSLYAFRWAGLDPTNGAPRIYLGDTISAFVNVDRAKTSDVVYIGNRTPQVFGSFLNTFSWKQLSVSVMITYRMNYYFRRVSASMSAMLTAKQGHIDYLKRWQKPGDELVTDVPSLPDFADDRDRVYQDADILVEKGDHIRLQDVRAGYSFDRLTYAKLPFKSAQLYVYAANLGILWRANKKGIDPDAVAFYELPAPRSFAIGLNLSF